MNNQSLKIKLKANFPKIYFKSRDFYRFLKSQISFKIYSFLYRSTYYLTKKIYFNMHKVHIETVGGCQIKCVGCPASTIYKKIKIMSVDDFNKCLKNINVPHIQILRLFNFGEPLLNPNIDIMLMQIPKQSFTVDQVEIYTNGQYLNEKQLESIFKTRVLHSLTVSCDGNGTPEDYEALRPPAKWDTLLRFFSKATELRDKYAPELILKSETICDDMDGQKRWTEILQRYGWDINFRRFLLLPQAIRNKNLRSTKIPENACSWLNHQYLFVNCDCNVVPCCAHPKAAILGNLKIQKYSDVLFGKKYKLFLKRLSKRKDVPICNECGER